MTVRTSPVIGDPVVVDGFKHRICGYAVNAEAYFVVPAGPNWSRSRNIRRIPAPLSWDAAAGVWRLPS